MFTRKDRGSVAFVAALGICSLYSLSSLAQLREEETPEPGVCGPGDVFTDVRFSLGTPGNDELTGSVDDDFIGGGECNDILSGAAGDDHLEGGPGVDHLNGGGGDDELQGGAGVDHLEGSVGNDAMTGGSGDDTLEGGTDLGDDLLVGGSGADTLIGGPGCDICIGDADDTFIDCEVLVIGGELRDGTELSDCPDAPRPGPLLDP